MLEARTKYGVQALNGLRSFIEGCSVGYLYFLLKLKMD